MKDNRLKADLAQGKACVGTVVTIGSPVVAEIFAMAGYDWIWFDLEHTPMSLETLQSMIQAVNAYDLTVLVRVPGNTEIDIKRVLDLGPQGIIVPLINGPREAAEAVRYVKYPPLGVRGAGIGRAQGFGESSGLSYYPWANEQIMVIPQIEHIDAVNSIEEILAVPGVDALFLGTMDLSGSMGMLGHTDDPKVEAAQQHVFRACQAKGTPLGIMAMSGEQACERIREGYRFVGLGIDVDTIMRAAMQMLRAAERPPKAQRTA